MNPEVKEAINQFFLATKKLNQLGIIQSREYAGDIAKHLCQDIYNLELPESGRPAGYDGMIGSSRVQVRFNNCPVGSPIRLSEPFDYDELIVVLGPNCLLRPEGFRDEFVFYRFTRDEALEKFKTSDGKYIGGRDLFSEGYDKALNLA